MAGFDVLLAAASKIISEGEQGARLRNSLAPNMPDDTPDVQATVEELFSMVSAGLAGVAPHHDRGDDHSTQPFDVGVS